jgi:hypothetical protein
MKKTIIFLMAVSFLMTVNLYAQTDGNLIVEGKVGIGTSSLSGRKVIIEGSPAIDGRTLRVVNDTDGTGTGHYFVAGDFNANADSASGTDGAMGLNMLAGHDIGGQGGANFSTLTAGKMELRLGARDRTVSGDTATALNFRQITTGSNSTIYNITDLYGLYYHVDDYPPTNAATNPVNYRPIYISDPSDPHFSPTVGAQIWLDKLTAGTTKYGIVLDGDGAGSDIVFGPNQESRIYSSNGVLYASDNDFNLTQISPHDPETGEWIFYSKNTKTGRTVRVNMEELVRDMEKLTGKKYLIESFTEKPQKSVD